MKIVDAWGPWIPGCIYPGTWVGKYDDYDFLRQQHSPAHPMLYLFARLAWNPEQPVERIAGDWARLHFGNQATKIEKALALSEELWKTTYIGPSPSSGLAFKWTMLFQTRPELLDRVGQDWTTETIRSSNRRALELAGQIHKLILSIDPVQTPSPGMAREFHRSADLTELYFRTFALWRELVFRGHRAGANATDAERAALLAVAARLEETLPEWHRFPREAKDWLIFQFDPDLATAPQWMSRSSLADTVKELKSRVSKP